VKKGIFLQSSKDKLQLRYKLYSERYFLLGLVNDNVDWMRLSLNCGHQRVYWSYWYV